MRRATGRDMSPAGGGRLPPRPHRPPVGRLLLLLLLLLLLHAARPAQGPRVATNSSAPDVCATCHAHATCHQKEGKNVCICNYGFVGNGRTHCQDIDECQVSGLCGAGGRCMNTVGSYKCYCMEGYRPENGAEFFHPAGNTVSCKEISCGSAPEIVHGHIIGNYSSRLGSEVYYECEEGFYSEGGNVSVCTKEEVWEPSVLICKDVDCGVPPSVLNAYSAPIKGTTYRSEVAYICLDGYVIESGNQTAVCNAKGQWEGADLICKEIDCGRPLWIPNAEMIWDNSTTLGSTVYYKCREGFHFTGDKNFSQCTEIQEWENITGTCKVTDCGRPPSVPNTDMIWNNISQLGSTAHYRCIKGFSTINGRNMSRCTYNGSWEIPALTCKEEEGFSSVSVFNDTCLEWRRHSGRVGVQETYLFHVQEQQRYIGKSSHEMMINFTTKEENPALCLPLSLGVNYTVSITEASTKLVLQVPIVFPVTEEELLSNVSVFNETCVKWQRKISRAGPEETYTFHISGRRWYQKEFSREIIFNFTTDEETPEVCLELNSGTNYMVNITTASSKGPSALITIAIKTEVKEAFSNMLIVNDTCLTWRRSIRRGDSEEIYSFHIQGRRQYQKEFFHEMAFNLTTYRQTPEVCLDLRPGTNYTVNISSSALDLSVLVSMTTPITDPPFPDIEFVTVQGPAPTLSLRKVEDKNGPISSYQVIVLPLPLQSTFTCDSWTAVTFFNNDTDAEGYVAAEFLAKDVADNMLICLGDRHYYGAFYNAPLKQGKDYCVVLRIISQWNKMRTESCAIWAQIEDLSSALRHTTVAGLGSVAAVCLILLLSFLAARSYLHSTVHVPPAALTQGVSYETTMDTARSGIASSFLQIESVSLL
ncbi:sushi domain-containing protein 1 isoform X2 [Carettochelys insculpta]|uniref:sushi domain-containing protein 1 isoform X2 n=1 Tax=Carettochelys insculpta TaxID=44489 RepID=UPI003EBB6D30